MSNTNPVRVSAFSRPATTQRANTLRTLTRVRVTYQTLVLEKLRSCTTPSI